MITPNYLERLSANQLYDMAEFVVSENFKHHQNAPCNGDHSNEVNAVFDEELTYYNSSNIYAGKDANGAILGTIRVMKWNYVDPLPLQKIFVINPLTFVDTSRVNEIYHIGRLAIQKEIPSLQLFKQLMVCAISPVCSNKKNIAFAECDEKLLRILSLLGIKMDIIGKAVDYLGSVTIPVLLRYEGLIGFYNRHIELIKDIIMERDHDDNLKQLAI